MHGQQNIKKNLSVMIRRWCTKWLTAVLIFSTPPNLSVGRKDNIYCGILQRETV